MELIIQSSDESLMACEMHVEKGIDPNVPERFIVMVARADHFYLLILDNTYDILLNFYLWARNNKIPLIYYLLKTNIDSYEQKD